MFYCSTHGGKCKASGVLRPHSFLSLFGERKEPCRAAKKRKRRPWKPFGWFPRTPSIDQSLALDLRRMEVGESTIDFVGADAERICNAPSSRTAALGIGPYIRGGEDGRIGSSVPTFQTEKTPLAVPAHSQGRKLRGTTLIRSVCRSSLQPLTELARPAYYKRSPVLIVCGLR